MPYKTIKFDRTVQFQGRNGHFKQTGINLSDRENDVVMIEPITSKDYIGHCCIEIPASDIPELILALHAFMALQTRDDVSAISSPALPKRDKVPNIHFWEHVNDTWVKLTLKPGQILRWTQFLHTEEGWSSHSMSWHYDRDDRSVFCVMRDEGRDCDGRVSMSWSGKFSIDDFRREAHHLDIGTDKTGNPIHDPDIIWPEWHEVSREERDYTAEAAGY